VTRSPGRWGRPPLVLEGAAANGRSARAECVACGRPPCGWGRCHAFKLACTPAPTAGASPSGSPAASKTGPASAARCACVFVCVCCFVCVCVCLMCVCVCVGLGPSGLHSWGPFVGARPGSGSCSAAMRPPATAPMGPAPLAVEARPCLGEAAGGPRCTALAVGAGADSHVGTPAPAAGGAPATHTSARAFRPPQCPGQGGPPALSAIRTRAPPRIVRLNTTPRPSPRQTPPP
jgi:hypothetical protein